MKRKKNRLIDKIFLIPLLTLVGLYFFSVYDIPRAESWYSSSWLYRRPVIVSNPSSTLTNEDVLIVLDTATLIAAGKMQSDCDDIRVIDSDDTTPINYWIEGGCNTSSTQIWARIPTLDSGGETIYIYYSNPLATNSEQTWTGKFYLMKNSSCDSGWTTESNSGGDFYLKYPRGSSSFGTTGGSSSHDHGSASLTTDTVSGGVNNNSSGTENITDNHSHSVSVPVQTNSSVLPTYLDMIFCSNNDLVIKQNMVTPFDTTVPTGFTRFSALDSAFPRGNSSYTGTTGGSTTHSHNTTSASTGGPSATLTCSTGTTYTPSNIHTHTVSAGTTVSGTHIPEYIETIYGQADSDIGAPTSVIVMSNGTPPLGWTALTAFNGYFPYGSAAYGTTGGSPTHTHDVSLSTDTFTADVGCSTANPKGQKPTTHSHTVSGTTGSYSNNPPYIETIFIKKKTSQTVTINSEQSPNVPPDAPTSLWTESSSSATRVTDLTPEFSAVFTDGNSEDTANYYEIEVNSNNTFTGTVMWDSNQQPISPITNGARSPEISYDGLALSTNGATYYWRIRFWDNSSVVGDWSTASSFRMNTTPSAPTDLLAEGLTNPTEVVDLTPEFSAVFGDPDTGDTGAFYQIEVNTQSDFLGTSMWDSTLQSMTPVEIGNRSVDISYDGLSLSTDGSTYYWRIRFADIYGTVSDWSSPANFTMNTAPSAPSSLLAESQENPRGVDDLTPEFSAIFNDPDSVDTGNYYEIEVNTNNTFTGTVMWDSTLLSMTATTNGERSPDISYAGTVLSLDGSTYYWRIRFADNHGTVGEWSSVASFTMKGSNNVTFESITLEKMIVE